MRHSIIFYEFKHYFLISIMLVLLANIKTMYDYKKRIYIVEEVRKNEILERNIYF